MAMRTRLPTKLRATPPSRSCAPLIIGVALLACPALAAAQGGPVQRFDFQPAGAALETGYLQVLPTDDYSAAVGHGFTNRPRLGSNSAGKLFYNNTVPLDVAVASGVLSAKTQDAVLSDRRFVFRVDVPPGIYDVTLWLGDVGTPTHQVRAAVNGEIIDVERMDTNRYRGTFWTTGGQNPQTIKVGNAVPKRVRADASAGFIEVVVDRAPYGTSPITWDYLPDECPSPPPPANPITALMVPAFSAAGLQALELHPLADPPLGLAGGLLVPLAAPADPQLAAALAAYNAGDIEGAKDLALALPDGNLAAAKANLLFWIAGHPAIYERETELLDLADFLLDRWMTLNPNDYGVDDLRLDLDLARNAEFYRSALGYAAYPQGAAENLGRSCSLVENFDADHPYARKGQILFLRNRGGLDPRRCTVSWERAEYLAEQLDPVYGAVNPHVRLFAHDQWSNDGMPWARTDWAAVAGPGPDWARSLMASLNTHIDLFEWWIVHRQSAEGDIGGGWTDDVEIVPAFGLLGFVLNGMSPILEEGTIGFIDALWSDSGIIDTDAGYQAVYSDVEHSAEATGNSLQIYPMLAYGDPEGIERILKTARTHDTFFLDDDVPGHRHFIANHLGATQIGVNVDHRWEMPLNGRAFAPIPWLVWYSEHPGADVMMRDWISAWAEDARNPIPGKPDGVFPNSAHSEIHPPGDVRHVGIPGGDWWGTSSTFGVLYGVPSYQNYLYGMMGYQYLRTQDPAFRFPYDAAKTLTESWVAAGEPVVGSAPVQGAEDIWAGSKIKGPSATAMFDVARLTGISDWDAHIGSYGTLYDRFVLDGGTNGATLSATLDSVNAQVVGKWPFRTTEGVMTDRILLPGWFSMIPFFIGADITNVYYGMPVHMVTWSDTGRLFAAAVSKSTPTEVSATLYRFADTPQDVAVNVWGLELGAGYVLEAGPAPALGVFTATVAQSVAFTFTERGQAVPFTLPGRAEYAVRILRTAAAPSTPGLRPDLAVAPRDITLVGGQTQVILHNIGAADANNVMVQLFDGPDASGVPVAAGRLVKLEAPTDLDVPLSSLLKTHTFTFPFAPATLPAQVTVKVDPYGAIDEVTELNNTVTAWVGGASAELPAPMMVELSPTATTAGAQLTVDAKNLQLGLQVLDFEQPSGDFTVTFVSATQARISVGSAAASGTHLLSLVNPDGKTSNVLPLEVVVVAPLAASAPPPPPAQRRQRLDEGGAEVEASSQPSESVSCRSLGGSGGPGLLLVAGFGLVLRRRR